MKGDLNMTEEENTETDDLTELAERAKILAEATGRNEADVLADSMD